MQNEAVGVDTLEVGDHFNLDVQLAPSAHKLGHSNPITHKAAPTPGCSKTCMTIYCGTKK